MYRRNNKMLDREDERLTDNTKIKYCVLCIDCKNRNRTMVRGKEIGYEKCVCDIYDIKPQEIMYEQSMNCEFYKKDT